MVQIINDPNSGNIFGQIGRNFGQGLAEQLPKGIERGALSEGLKQLGKQDFSGKSPLETLGHIHGIPGITPEIAQQAQQQVTKQNVLNRRNSRISTPEQNTEKRPLSQSNENNASGKSSIFASSNDIKNYKNSLLQEPDFNEVEDLADQYLLSNITQDYSEAKKLAKEELQQNLTSQNAKLEKVRPLLNERIGLGLQSSGLGDFKKLTGKIQQKLIDNAMYSIGKKGESPELALEVAGDVAEEVGKSINKLKETSGSLNSFLKPKDMVQDIEILRDEFSSYGPEFEEDFDNIAAAATGLTPLQIASIVSPIQNKKILSALDQLKPMQGLVPKSQEKADKIIDDIIDNIHPSDNILSIENALREKHFDLRQFRKKLDEAKKNKKIKIEGRQKRQFETPVSNNFLGDILFRAMRGHKK